MNPHNEAARCRLVTLLTYRSLAIPRVRLQHRDEINSARFGPDGQLVITASKDKTAQLWNPRTGETVGPPLTHSNAVNDARFSSDGSSILTVSESKSVRVWNTHTDKSSRSAGKPKPARFKLHGLVRRAQWFF